jgi:apolipoprotein N-acyltransferase
VSWPASGKLRPLRKLALQPDEWRRFALALIAGLAQAASFPKIGVAGLGWLAPALMLAAAAGQGGGAAFRIGYVAGLVRSLATFYWLLYIPVSFAPIVGWLALSAYLALYPALWVWLCWKLYPADLRQTERRLIPLLNDFLSTHWAQRLQWALLCAALWVAGEMVLARLFTGFPWSLLGTSQFRVLPLIQIASSTGVYGVSFLMVWLSASLLGTVAALVQAPERRRSWMIELIVPMLCLVAVILFGMRKLFHSPRPGPTLKIALVQPSIPQTMIWDASESAQRLQQVLALSETALATKPDLVVWPEAAVPGVLRWDTNRYGDATLYEAVTSQARRHHVWMVVGADDAAPNPRVPDQVDYFNSSFLIDPSGGVVATYRKRRLVIFGEYMPLARWLPFMRSFTGVTGDFTSGTRAVPFILSDVRVKLSVLICFEDIFPDQTREYVEEDTDFLLNLTNNGWFGESAAQWQQAANAVFRAVENGLPVVRCANNGLTCWVDGQGRMNEVYFPGTTDIYGVGYKVAQVPLLAGQRRPPTFYRQHGDWFGWMCVGLAGLTLVRLLARRRKG